LDTIIYGDGSLTISGDLTVNGSLTSLNTTNTTITDGIVAANFEPVTDGRDGGLWIGRTQTDIISDTPAETGTAQVGSTASTIVLDLTASVVDDYYNGWIIEITGGTGIGQTRAISDYTGGTMTAIISPDWMTIPDATSTYNLFNTPTPAIFWDESSHEVAIAYTADPHTANPLTITQYANLHVGNLIIDGDITGFSEIVTLIENSSTPVNIEATSTRGAYFITVQSVVNDGAAATFAASSNEAAVAGTTTRFTNSAAAAPSSVEVDITYLANNKVQLYHSVTGPTGASIQYLVVSKSVSFISGESNTASNVGLSGVGLFQSKVGVDLQFRNIDVGSNKLSVTLDAPNSTVDLDAVEANFDINALGGGPLTVPNGGTGATSFTSGDILQGNGAAAISASGIQASTIVTLNGVQTLTNKTLTDGTNNVIARGLWHSSAALATDYVSTYASTAPSSTGQVLTIDALGPPATASWQDITFPTKIATYTLSALETSVLHPTWITFAYFTWLNSRYSSYTNGILIYYVVIPGTRTIDIRLQNTTAATTLASNLGIAVTGWYSTAVTSPVANAQLELQVQRSGGTGIPIVYGVNLEFEY
jgi:hypothetical protein